VETIFSVSAHLKRRVRSFLPVLSTYSLRHSLTR
jgi:hypothetical protein